MKRLFFALIAVFGFAAMSHAQKAEFQIGYGGFTQMDAMDMSDGGDANNAWGALTLGVNFNVAPNFKIGPSYTFSSASFKYVNKSNVYYHVIMLNGFYDYWRNNIVKLYAHVGVGVDISHLNVLGYTENKAYFAFDIVPLGAQVDLTNVTSIFGELGFGAQGLLSVGARFRF